MIPSSASSSRERSPPRQRAHLLERVVAPEQEPGEVAARLAGRDRDRLEERVEHGRARDRRPAELGEVADRDAAADRQDAVERRQLAGDRPQQRRLARAVRPDDADPLAALGGEERDAGDDTARGIAPPALAPAPSASASPQPGR